jgi:hypothetical protein
LIDPETGEAKNPPKQDPNAFMQEGSQGEFSPRQRNVAGMRGTGADILGIQGSQRGREFFQSGGPVNPPNTVPMNRPTANLADLAIAHPTGIESRRQFFEGGGEVPGMDTGQDQVPAMLRSEELVVTPELVEAIQAAQTPDAAMAVVEALKVLAQKPLEFDEEQGEHVAQSGGLTPEQIMSLSGGLTPPAQIDIDPMSEEEKLLHMARSGLLLPTIPGANIPPAPGLAPTSGPTEPLEPQIFDVEDMRRQPEMKSINQMIPVAPTRVQSTADIIPGDIPTLTAFGPGPGETTGPTKFGPGVNRGTVSRLGTDSLTEDELQLARVERAKSRRDLIQHALITDPIGGPEKFARLNNALENAERQVDHLVNEVAAKETHRLAQRQTDIARLGAEAQLSEATSARLQAEAQKATAFAVVAEKLQAMAANDPRAAVIIDMFSKIKPKGKRGEEMVEAALKIMLERLGTPLKENGWIRQVLFGAPTFELDAEGIPPLETNNPEIAALLNGMLGP